MITIGTIHGGTVNNVIPDTVEMTGTIRSFAPEVRKQLHEELAKAVKVVEPLGGRAELAIHYGYPPLVNGEEATDVMMGAMADLLGAENVQTSDLIMGAEDFAYMAKAAPGCFLRLGNGMVNDIPLCHDAIAGKRIGSHVQNSHHIRAGTPLERKTPDL